jgi:hypothetical protein
LVQKTTSSGLLYGVRLFDGDLDDLPLSKKKSFPTLSLYQEKTFFAYVVSLFLRERTEALRDSLENGPNVLKVLCGGNAGDLIDLESSIGRLHLCRVFCSIFCAAFRLEHALGTSFIELCLDSSAFGARF